MPTTDGCSPEEFENKDDDKGEDYCSDYETVCTKNCLCCACTSHGTQPWPCGVLPPTTRRPKKTTRIRLQARSTQGVSSPKTTDKIFISTSNYTNIRTSTRTKFSIPSVSSQGLTAATTHGRFHTERGKNHSATYTAQTNMHLATTAAITTSKATSTLIPIIVGVVVAVIIILAILTLLLMKFRKRKSKRKQTIVSNQYDVVLPLNSTVEDPGYEQLNRSNVESSPYSYVDVDRCRNRPTNLGKIPPKKGPGSQASPPYSYVDTNFVDRMILKNRTLNANNTDDNGDNEPKYFELVCEDKGPCAHAADFKGSRSELTTGQGLSPAYAELIPETEGGKACVMIAPLAQKKVYAQDQRHGIDRVSSPVYAEVLPELDNDAYKKNSSTNPQDRVVPREPTDVPEPPVYFELAPEAGEGNLAHALEQAKPDESNYRELSCAENSNQYQCLNVEDDDYRI